MAAEKKVVKGISTLAKNNFTYQDYLQCLTNQISKKAIDYRIKSKRQVITSNMVKYIALASFSDKRYILQCGIHSQPYSIKNNDVCYASKCKKT